MNSYKDPILSNGIITWDIFYKWGGITIILFYLQEITYDDDKPIDSIKSYVLQVLCT